MRGDPSLVPDAIDISRRTYSKIRQGLFWAFIYNVVGIPLAALGVLSPVIAGAAMAFSSVSVVSKPCCCADGGRARPSDRKFAIKASRFRSSGGDRARPRYVEAARIDFAMATSELRFRLCIVVRRWRSAPGCCSLSGKHPSFHH